MARRKITAAADEASALPDLTPQQLRFVEGIVAGKSAADSYRAAYDTSEMQNNTIWARASELRAHGAVAVWIDAVKAAGFGKVSCTYDEHMTELARLRGAAERSGNFGAAVQAEQLRGKVAGHYVDQVRDITPINPHETLKDIAALNPALAAELAAAHGITDWRPDEGATKH